MTMMEPNRNLSGGHGSGGSSGGGGRMDTTSVSTSSTTTSLTKRSVNRNHNSSSSSATVSTFVPARNNNTNPSTSFPTRNSNVCHHHTNTSMTQNHAATTSTIHDDSKGSDHNAINHFHQNYYEPLKPNETEQNLYNFPDSLSTTYQKIPFFTKALILLLSTFISIHSCQWRSPSMLSLGIRYKGMKQLVKFILKIVAISLASSLIVQESFYPPSRIDASTLIQRQWLPSTLSKFSTVSTSIDPQLYAHRETIGPLNTHYLSFQPLQQQQQQNQQQEQVIFDCIHFNHGFGASSLSWLPAIPSLANKLNAKVAIAHDSPGFGFTERTKTWKVNSLIPYTSTGSAMIGNSLLLKEINDDNNTKTNNIVSSNDEKNKKKVTRTNKRVALFGHSMGCSATLKMALCLPRDIAIDVILVAPALLGSLPSRSSTRSVSGDIHLQGKIVQNSILEILKRQPTKLRSWFGLLISALRTVILDAPLMLLLKRLVARPNFWLNGLRLAWGNPDLVTQSDALRFQWPSILLGWERGLLAFTRSRLFAICNYNGGELKLLDDVIQLPNTSVVIVHGSKDPVVPVTMSRRIQEHWKSLVTYVEMEGQGHDPFEEGIEEFVEKVVNTLKMK